MISSYEILVKNLPQGELWHAHKQPVLDALLQSFGQALDNVAVKIRAFSAELTPSSAKELLPEWEKDANIPDACFAKEETNQARQKNLRLKILQQGALSFDDIKIILAQYNATITQSKGRATITLPALDNIYARCGNIRCGERLLDFVTTSSLKCWLERILPAHLYISFVSAG